MKKKTIVIIISILLAFVLGTGIFGLITYNKLNSSAFNIDQSKYIYIDERKDYQDLLIQLKETGSLKNISLFNRVAGWIKYPQNMKSGRYKITPEISYLDILRMLRRGSQDPVKLTFNNIRLKKDFAARIGEQLMLDEEDLLNKLSDPQSAKSFGFDTSTIVTLFIPNTYEFYWNVNADMFLDRMKKEYDRFWTPQRKEKAAKINLSPTEVSILASIVEEETAVESEYSVVAGLYLNRLKQGMLLQADPTVKFAVGDVTLKRILFKHLEVDSPYNTYKNPGLPPGPIRIPSIQAIDGVLDYQHHSYLYMCAKEDFSGTHNFARTLKEHNRNAQKYQAALNRAGIR